MDRRCGRIAGVAAGKRKKCLPDPKVTYESGLGEAEFFCVASILFGRDSKNLSAGLFSHLLFDPDRGILWWVYVNQRNFIDAPFTEQE